MKFKFRYTLFSITVCIYCNAFSQSYDNNWVFGDSAGLNFSTGIPIDFTSAMRGWEANASISDKNGNLLFYTNGKIVWNKNHEIMSNGDSLDMGQVDGDYGSSITQGVIILPYPDNENEYYIFQIQSNSGAAYCGIEYSIVDMSLEGGFGKLIIKNSILLDSIQIQEKMIGVKHGNGRDWWLLLRNFNFTVYPIRNIDYVKYLISPDGISGPFYQDVGQEYDETLDTGWGQITISQDGSKLLFPRGTKLNLFDFNRCTGELSNMITINLVDMSAYGNSFSPDASKIYVNDAGGNKIYQYCLDCDGEPIDSTREIVFDEHLGQYGFGQQLLGPDGKIYIAMSYDWVPNNVFSNKNQNLCVINYPNEKYPLCDFDTNTVSLGIRRTIGGLPNMSNYSLGPLVGSECDTLLAVNNVIQQTNIHLYPNPAIDHIYFSGNAAYSGAHVVLHVFNLTGLEVFSKQNIQFNSAIPLPKLPEGLYTVTLENATGVLFKDKVEIVK